MRHSRWSLALLLTLLCPLAARAGDFGRPYLARPLAYDWSGLHVGINAALNSGEANSAVDVAQENAGGVWDERTYLPMQRRAPGGAAKRLLPIGGHDWHLGRSPESGITYPPAIFLNQPSAALWRLADVPRYLPAEQVNRLIAACDGDAVGRQRIGRLMFQAMVTKLHSPRTRSSPRRGKCYRRRVSA